MVFGTIVFTRPGGPGDSSRLFPLHTIPLTQLLFSHSCFHLYAPVCNVGSRNRNPDCRVRFSTLLTIQVSVSDRGLVAGTKIHYSSNVVIILSTASIFPLKV